MEIRSFVRETVAICVRLQLSASLGAWQILHSTKIVTSWGLTSDPKHKHEKNGSAKSKMGAESDDGIKERLTPQRFRVTGDYSGYVSRSARKWCALAKTHLYVFLRLDRPTRDPRHWSSPAYIPVRHVKGSCFARYASLHEGSWNLCPEKPRLRYDGLLDWFIRI